MPTNIQNNSFYDYQYQRRANTDKSYFSGANARVYFGDIWVEEMVSIQFGIDENVAPIYGFNSYMFDKVARGTRMVSGAFIINHTETDYINIILEELYRNIDSQNKNLLGNSQLDGLMSDLTTSNSIRNIENLLEINEGKTYNEYVRNLRNSYWGTQSTSQNTIQKRGMAREYDTNYFKNKEGSSEVNLLKDHGFNILIDYSPSANERDFKAAIKNLKNKSSLSQSFRSIIGVHITGENQIISPDGQPIQTQYNFIARDVDGDVTQLSMKHNQMQNNVSDITIPLRTSTGSMNRNNPYGVSSSGAKPSSFGGGGGRSFSGGGGSSFGGGSGGGTR